MSYSRELGKKLDGSYAKVVKLGATPAEKASARLLQAATAPYASAATSYLYNVALCAVEVVTPRFRDSNGDPRAAHTYVIGIVTQS